MNDFLRSHTLITGLALCLIGFLSFWALEKDKCFEINIEDFILGANCKD